MTNIKQAGKQVIAHLYYENYMKRVRRNWPLVDVCSVNQTISMLQNTDHSLVRFGDGELTFIRGRNLQLQNSNRELQKRLADILGYSHDGLVVSVQDIFNGLNSFVPASRSFWEDHFFFYHEYYERLCRHDREYANSLFSRCYITRADKSRCGEWFSQIRKIWEGKDVVVVEGTRTHNGVDNDLLSLCSSVERILIPPANAFDAYDRILGACLKFPSDRLFLISAGASAKPLTEDLFLKDYRVIDIGNLDMEYCWFLMNAREKVAIQKHSIVGREANRKAGYLQYLDEIRQEIQ